jgi:hypothetical protein
MMLAPRDDGVVLSLLTTRADSFNGLTLVVLSVVGSASSAPAYLRIAELMPFV